MRALKGTLTFILGMIMGVILFLAAIAGTIYAVATSVSVGQLQDTVGVKVFDDGEMTEKTLWDIGKSVYEDISNFSSMSLNQIAEKYGLKTKLDSFAEVSGIDISPIFDVPIPEIANSLNKIIEGITLNDVGELTGMDFNSYNLPVLTDNLYNSVTAALDSILKTIDGDSMSLRAIEDNFGLNFGENQIFTLIKDVSLSSFGAVVNGLEIGAIIDSDCDLFAVNGSNSVFVKVDRYEEVATADIDAIKTGASTYVSGIDDSDNLVFKELRYVKKTKILEDGSTENVTDADGNQVYKVDNSCYEAAVEGEEAKTYFRFIEYAPYDASATYAAGTEFFIPAYSNKYVASGATFALKQDGYISLNDLYTSNALSTALNAGVSGATVTLSAANVFYKSADDTPVAIQAEAFGKDTEEKLSENTRLSAGGTESHLRIHTGTSDAAIQAIAHTTVKGLNNATDALMSVKLGELIEITEDSSEILKAMKDKPVGELSNVIDDLVLADVVEIDCGLYVEDEDGIYVYVSTQASYVEYDAVTHAGMTRYELGTPVANTNGKYVIVDGVYYLYKSADDSMSGLTRYDKVYTEAAAGGFVKVDEGGYYTLYIPSEHAGVTRYSKITDSADAATPDYLEATDDQISDSAVVKYYYNPSTKAMQTAEIAGATAYVKGAASSKVLQRLAYASIGDFSSAFSSLILGDVLDIEVDTFAVTTDFSDLSVDYYYFEGGLYKLADSAYRAANPDATVYKVDVEGSGNAILKKLALIKIDEISAKMDGIVDSLFLADVIDVTASAYVPDADGKYVYIADGRYYTLYNPAVHSASAQRYSVFVGEDGGTEVNYSIATKDQIADSETVKYYYNTTTKDMQTTEIAGTTAYVRADASAKVLQRLGRTPIEKFNDTFKTLAIGDVMDIDIDVFEKVADSFDAAGFTPVVGTDYYYYSDGVYLTAYPTDTAWQTANATAAIYVVAAEGTGNAVIKRMAYTPVEEIGNKMDVIIDDLALGDVVDVVTDVYIADADGKYAYVADGNYYTVFNPAVHSGLPRFTRLLTDAGEGVREATEAEIAAGTGLYYWDTVNKKLEAYVSGDLGTLYVVNADISSKTLQRFVNVKIGKFSSAFSELLLSDVIDVSGDTFAAADDDYITANPLKTYYYYDNGLFKEQTPVLGDSTDYYYIAAEGESHIVLKKMAFLKIDDLGSRMTEVINGMYLTDLVEINGNDSVRDFVGGTDAEADARWLISYDPDYTTKEGGETYYHAFVYDENGKYYLSNVKYVELTAAQLAEFNAGTISYGYTKVTDSIHVAALAVQGITNFYYLKGTDPTSEDSYVSNPALCTYLMVSKNDYSKIYYRDTTKSDFSSTTYNQYTYGGEAMLYVKLLGSYVSYNSANAAHALSTVDFDDDGNAVKNVYYMRLTDGYNLPAAGQSYIEDGYEFGNYYFDTADSTFKMDKKSTSLDIELVQNNAKDALGNYYYVKKDDGYTTQTTYSKQLCSEIYYNDGEYPITGYLATLNETALSDGGGGYTNFLSTDKMIVTKAKSAPILLAFARDKVTVSNLSASIDAFTISDLMDIDPDSMFDDPDIKHSTIDGLSSVFQNKLQTMSINDIMSWSNINTLKPNVAAIIGNATLEDFFGALTYDTDTGSVTINMEKLYGLE